MAGEMPGGGMTVAPSPEIAAALAAAMKPASTPEVQSALPTAPALVPQQGPSEADVAALAAAVQERHPWTRDMAPAPSAPPAPEAPAAPLASRIAGDIGGGVMEAPGQILRGIQRALNATSGAMFDGAGWLSTHLADLGQVTYDRHGSWNPGEWSVGWAPGMPRQNDVMIPDAAIPGPASTITGGLIEGAAQFATGMAGAGKFLRVFGASRVTGAAATAGLRTVEGGASMGLAFDPHEQRLSDLVQQFPSRQNPVTEFLATHEDDSAGMARVRAGLEGLGMGAATEGFLAGLRSLRARYAGDVGKAVDHADPVPPKVGETTPEGTTTVPEGVTIPEGSVVLPPVEVVAEGAAEAKPEGPTTGQPGAAGEHPTVAREEAPQQLDLFQSNPDAGGKMGAPGSPHEAFAENPTAAAAGSPGQGVAPQARPLVNLTPEDVSRLRELGGNVERAPTTDADGVLTALHGINTDAIEHSGHLSEVLSTLRAYLQPEMDAVTGGTASADGVARPVRTWAEVRANADRIADAAGANPAEFMQRIGNMAGNLQNLDAETRVYGSLLATVGDKVFRLAKALDDPNGAALAGYADRPALERMFGHHVEMLATIQAQYQGIQTNIARALNAFKLGARIEPQLLAAVRDPRDLYTLARQIHAGGGNPVTVAKQTRPGFWRRLAGIGNEYWINSVLSGPKTHAANIMGNTLSAAVMPAERMLAGALRLSSQEGRNEFLEGGLHYVGMAMSLRDAITLSGRALRMGEGILDAAHTPVSELGAPAISASGLGMNPNSPSATIVNGIGAVVRVPSRFLTAEDEFFKQLVYRGAVRAKAMREGFQAGLWNDATNPRAFSEYVTRKLDEAATTGRTDPEALKLAQQATFQTDLSAQTNTGGRTIGETIQEASNNHPMLKLIVPFVRTPTNMIRYTWDHTPGINLARAQFRNDLMGSNGIAAQAQAMAKTLTGGTLWAAAITYALDGTITGAGPSDKAAQQALKATGWQPYSYKVTNPDGTVSYRSYDRLDPFGTFMGLAADFSEVAMAHPERSVADTAGALVTAVVKNLENKTYVSGLVRALAALGDPDKKAEGFAKGIAGGFVPSFLRQTIMQDDTMREARSIVDAMRARTPGFSDQLDPQRNILGAPVHQSPAWGPDWLSPIGETSHPAGAQPVSAAWRTTPQARPEDELARLAYNHGTALKPLPTKHGQLDWTAYRSDVTGRTVYDRLQELTGIVQMNGMTLREAIASTTKLPEYQHGLTDGDSMDPGSRLSVMERWVSGYREMAREALFNEQPAMRTAYEAEQMRKARARFAQ